MNRAGENKPPMDLIPDVLELVAEVLGHGAQKHGRFGWRTLDVEPVEWINASDRHTLEYKRGGRADHESGLHPLAHAIADLMIALEKDLQKQKRGKASVGADFGSVPPKTVVIFDELHSFPADFKMPNFSKPHVWQWRSWRRYRTAESRFWMATTAAPPPRWWQFWRRSK